MKSRLRRLLVVAALLAGSCAALSHGGGFSGPPGGVAQTGERVAVTVGPDAAFNRLFTRFGGGWTGGDGTYSIGLPGGGTVWMFGDTFLGRVREDRTRPEDTPLIHNCFVVQEGNTLKTLHGGTPALPEALVTPPGRGGWYWPADGIVEGDTLRVFFRRFQATGPAPWQFAWVGTDLAAFSLPGLRRTTLTPLTHPNAVMYGSSILETPATTYIFGTEDLGVRKYAHLARAKAGRITDPWEFFTGDGWSPDAGRTARILEGVANQFSVLEAGGRYLLLTMDNLIPFTDSLVCYLAPHPSGPWEGPVTVYKPPEAAGDVVAYNAFAHPQFTRDNRLLVSYNLNSVSDFSIPYADADAYRPRFIRVDLQWLLGRFRQGK